jgi:CHASE2 domain
MKRPYHDTLSMTQLSSLADHELAQRIGGRFLIVGGAIPGYNDFVDSPIHGLIPGPYMHAMALDNLLTFKEGYRLSTDWNNPSLKLCVSALFAVSVVFFVNLLFSFVRTIMSKRNSKTVQENPLRTVVIRIIGWVLRLSVGTVAVLLVIPILQNWFRIGMLPVVELVTMSLAAEALDYLEKNKSFLVKNAFGIDAEIQNYIGRVKSWFS